MKSGEALELLGLLLNVVGTGLIFLFAYPPLDERRRRYFLALTRGALLFMFIGFVLQFIAVCRRINGAG